MKHRKKIGMLFLLCVLFLPFFSATHATAMTKPDNIKDDVYAKFLEYKAIYPYYFLVEIGGEGSGTYIAGGSSKPFTFGSRDSNPSWYSICSESSDSRMCFYDYDGFNDVNFPWHKLYRTVDDSSNGTIFNQKLARFAYLNFDLLDEHTGMVVFQAPATPILAEMIPEETAVMTLSQIVGLIPLLIPFLVGLVAFWKAWQFLLRLLQKA